MEISTIVIYQRIQIEHFGEIMGARLARNAGAATAGVLALCIAEQSGLQSNLKLARSRWHDNPAGTGTDILLSGIGQVYFWTIGQDFIGIGMDKKWGPGLGHLVAPVIQKRLPQNAVIAWTIKVVEIASDATKMPIESKLYRDLGLVPDAVAALTTQPAWSLFEVLEKIIGITKHPERINTPGQITDSLSSIYGTWSRNLLSLGMARYGRRYWDIVGDPIERRIKRSVA